MLLLRRVVGDSMLPAFAAGQVVIAVRTRRPRTGDVVIARHDGLEKIKRVRRTAAGRVYLMGDNADASTDSRHFGWLPRRAVIAKVVWPKPRPVAVE